MNSNTARQLQQRETKRIAKKQVVQPKKASKSLWRLTKIETSLLVGALLLICYYSFHIVSGQAMIYSLNKEIQVKHKVIEQKAQDNKDLHVQVKELSTYERIWAKAKKLGLTLNENNVKVVQK